ncbi:MAG: adenine phosphoribosyltransferase [Bacteroidales bacterium]|jgi:adenine phosphoribosyltransferase|nr:adenine phosphoribosyltransferase [Bacteroidales bacterium]
MSYFRSIYAEHYKKLIRQYQGFPNEKVLFQDINPLLSNRKALQEASKEIADAIDEMLPFVTKILCVEARGFLLGGVLATLLDAGCVPIRKKGKLPPYASVRHADYALEYGTNSISLDTSLIEYNDKMVIFDDVLATGGTVDAVYRMLEEEISKERLAISGKGNLCFAFLLEIEALGGRKKLIENTGIPNENIFSLIKL